ncbi:hypothetical protein [Pseudomonas sp. HMWF006]|uniref:hypothetical protein n=1 Tax=Pseudomonas sp. HMWF006 TaxID=2056843 RepID=UPI000D49EF3B|nr:hypothetical protein [Pseudomonas sp. HMWF006]PTS98033.1 hypothetical protein DBR24_15335 [Pseudomonas sp. HMWF006]PTT73141.1 hypothetical protein DBR26_03680 [Pseudomonas sp. HMWF007]PTT87719.1 hypothetical protein DBR29_19405 [Pseudomonas sp. HMWF005]
MTEIKLLFAATGITLLVLIISNVLVMIYVGYFKLSEIELHLENCYLLHNCPQKGRSGFWARRYRLNLITALVLRACCWIIRAPSRMSGAFRWICGGGSKFHID